MLINEIKNFGPSEYINCPMDLKVSHMDHQTGPWTTPLRRSDLRKSQKESKDYRKTL